MSTVNRLVVPWFFKCKSFVMSPPQKLMKSLTMPQDYWKYSWQTDTLHAMDWKVHLFQTSGKGNNWRARMTQGWERLPPTNVSWVGFPDPTSYVGWVCCWFSSVLREVFLRVLLFSPLLKNQHFQIPILAWNKVIWFDLNFKLSIIVEIGTHPTNVSDQFQVVSLLTMKGFAVILTACRYLLEPKFV